MPTPDGLDYRTATELIGLLVSRKISALVV